MWNGRQIRNAFQSAIALASFALKDGQEVKLKTEHFKKVAEASDEFNRYLWRVKKDHTDADLASNHLMRADDFRVSPPALHGIHQSAPLQAMFGQSQARVPSPAFSVPGLTVPQAPRQQMYMTSGQQVTNPQFGQPQMYSGQVPQGYAVPVQPQGQQPQQQAFYRTASGFATQPPTSLQPPPQQP